LTLPPRALWSKINDRPPHQIGNLTAAEKSELLDALWESLEAGALPLTDTQRAELARRVEQYEKDPSDAIPWEQVRLDLFGKE